MKKIIKSILARCCPALYYSISSYRFYSSCKKRFSGFQNEFAGKMYKNDDAIVVLEGPFKGMKYFNKVVWGPLTPKWLGSYEEELHPVLTTILSSGYDLIVDVGAAEGYYAVGFSYSCRSSRVLSFDVDPIARRRQKELSILNGVDNLVIGTYCSHTTLSEILTDNSLLFCDIEGAEYELLDPRSVAKLKETDIVVELHPFKEKTAEDVRDDLLERFRGTHEIAEIPVSHRDVRTYISLLPQIEEIGENMIEEAMREYRSGSLGWLWMKSKKLMHV